MSLVEWLLLLAAALAGPALIITAVETWKRNRTTHTGHPFTLHAAQHHGFTPTQWATLTPEQQHHYAKDNR